MRPNPLHQSRCPEPLLRELATSTLSAKRCSTSYLSALRVILGSMALADRLGVRLKLPLDVTFASKQTMRTLIDQLDAAGLLVREGWTDSVGHAHVSHVYLARSGGDAERSDLYSRIQREQEDLDFRQFMAELGVREEDCPY